jgi:hypothetical protein
MTPRPPLALTDAGQEFLSLAETDPTAVREVSAAVVAVWDAYGLGRFEESECRYLLARRLQLARNPDTRYE